MCYRREVTDEQPFGDPNRRHGGLVKQAQVSQVVNIFVDQSRRDVWNVLAGTDTGPTDGGMKYVRGCGGAPDGFLRLRECVQER